MMKRLRALSIVGQAIDRLSVRLVQRRIQTDDQARLAVHGEDGPTAERLIGFAAEIDKRTSSIQS
jgi:hypothetical protein